MTNTVVDSGHTLSGAVFSSGSTAVVRKDGVLDASTVDAGATLTLQPHALAHHLSVGGVVSVHAAVDHLGITAGGVATLYSGADVTGGTVASGGAVVVNAGTGSGLSLEFGASLAQFGGRTSNTTVHAGAQQTVIGGTAMSTYVHTGGELVVSGGDVRHVRIGDGAQAELSGGAMAGVIRDGGTLFVFGGVADLSGLTARAGAEVVLVGGASETGLTVESGASLQTADVLTFTISGAATFAGVGYSQAYDPTQDIVAYAGADQAFAVSGGTLTLSSGAIDSAGALQGVTEYVLSGGGDRDSGIDGGSQVVAAGGATGFDDFKTATQFVDAGGSARTTRLASDSFQVVASGGIANNTLGAGTIDDRGGTVENTVLAGDTLVFDAISSATLSNVSAGSGGTVVVLGSSVTVSAGSLMLGSGATLIAFGGTSLTGATIADGATVISADVGIFTNGDGAIDPVAAGTVISGVNLHNETMRVWAGGSALAAHVDSGSLLLVSGGFVSDARVFSGGTMVVSGGTVDDARVHASGSIVVDGGTVSGTEVQSGTLVVSAGSAEVTSVLSGGTMTIDAAGTADGLTINLGGFVRDIGALTDVHLRVGGTLDMTGFAYATGGSATLNASDVLTVHEHGQDYTVQMSGAYGGTAFGLASDGSGGTLITLSAVAPAVAGAVAGGELVRGGGFAVLSAAAVRPVAALGASFSPHAATAEPFNHLLPHAQ